MNFQRIKDTLLCILLVSIIYLVVSIKRAVDTTTEIIQSLPKIVQVEIDKTRQTVHTEFQQTRDFTGEQVSILTKTADRRLASIQGDLREASLETIFNSTQQLDLFNRTLDHQLTITNDSIAKLTNVYAEVPKILGERLDPFTDCDHNGLCWQNQVSDTLFAVRTTSRDVSTTMSGIQKTSDLFNVEFPKISKDSEQIADNINKISDNIKRITTPHWYDRVLGYTLNGVTIYRELNPLTNITTSITAAISSQK